MSLDREIVEDEDDQESPFTKVATKPAWTPRAAISEESLIERMPKLAHAQCEDRQSHIQLRPEQEKAIEQQPTQVAVVEPEPEGFDGEFKDEPEEPEIPPDESWNPAIAALREVHYLLSRNLCATALRYAPKASTVIEIHRIIRHVHPGARCYSSTTSAALNNLRKEGLATKEIHDGRDVGGNIRPLSHWLPTDALRESFTETVPGNHYGPRLVRGPAVMSEEQVSLADKIKRRIAGHEIRIVWHESEIRRLEEAMSVLEELS